MNTPTNVAASANQVPIHYVGIGASAGGLEAIQTFFKQMQKGSNLAFVVIQHLSPDYKSLMSELVAKITDIPVHVAQDNMEVKADNIYLIPPRKNLKIFHGHLILTEQERSGTKVNLPIDIFLTSLAEDQGHNAIGVILSGTGSDGTRGCRAIKEVGGMVMVQDEATAKFDGMPKSVISNGLADFVLAVEDMPEQLMSFVKHPYTARQDNQLPLTGEKRDLAKIFSMLREKSKIDFTFYKPSTIVRRIERRMTVNHLDSLGGYVRFLMDHPQEQNTLFKELLIGVTSFFRDSEVFDNLRAKWLRELIETNESKEFRIWVAGCSSGEEAYSYAILCHEIMQQVDKRPEIKIFATDIDYDAINKAGNGIFPESITADIPDEYLAKYFTHRGESYQVARQIREMVVFAQHNIIKDPPFTNISLVSCRNLLIYLQPILQQKIFDNFNFSLKKNGLLVLGSSESVGDASKLFEPLHPKHKIFRALGQRRTLPDFGHYEYPEPYNPPLYAKRAITLHDQFGTDESTMLSAFIDGVVNDYILCAMIVDEDMRLLHVTGDASRFVLPFSGKVSTEIAKNINKDLLIPISTGLTKVFKTHKELTFSNIKVAQEHFGTFKVNIRIKPLAVRKGKTQLAAVLITDLNKTVENAAGSIENYDVGRETEQRINDLEQELQFTRENLQATIEELETSNEELQATNEELMASNEELQSTNEELQSVNEELFTVNTEFQNKIVELTELNNDMDNFMNNADVIALFLDENLDIRKFTNNASMIFNVRDSDIGRPFAELTDHLLNFDLKRFVQKANSSHEAHKYEVQSDDGNWYYLRILPYIIANTIHSGVVVILNEINSLKHTQQDLINEYERQNLAYQMMSIGTWDWDIEKDELTLSEQATKIFGKEPRENKGTFEDLIQTLHPDDKAKVEHSINVALANDGPYVSVHRIVLPDDEVRWIEEIGHLVKNNAGKSDRMIGVARDITAQKSVRRDTPWLHKSTEMMLDATGEGICGFNTKGEFNFVNHAAALLLGWRPEELTGRQLKLMLYLIQDGEKSCSNTSCTYTDTQCPVMLDTSATPCLIDCSPFNCLLYETLVTGKNFVTDKAILLTKSGQKLPVALISSPVYADGQLTGGVIVFRDLALMLCEQEERQLLNVVMTLSNQIFIVQNINGDILSWSAAAAHLYGYPELEALTMNYRQIIPESEHEKMAAFFQKVLANPSSSRATNSIRLAKSGAQINVNLTALATSGLPGQLVSILTCESLID